MVTRSKSYPRALESRAQIHDASLALIRSVFPPHKGIRLVGVTLSNFSTMADLRGGDLLLQAAP